jgi:hypothetical protein
MAISLQGLETDSSVELSSCSPNLVLRIANSPTIWFLGSCVGHEDRGWDMEVQDMEVEDVGIEEHGSQCCFTPSSVGHSTTIRQETSIAKFKNPSEASLTREDRLDTTTNNNRPLQPLGPSPL